MDSVMLAAPPRSAGVMKKPRERRNTKVAAVATPRSDKGQEHAAEGREPGGTKPLAGAEQGRVDPGQRRVDRQHRVGQEDVDHADEDARMVEEEGERLVDEAAPDEEAVHGAVALKQQHPGEGAHEDADPEGQQHASEQRRAPARAQSGSGPARGDSRSRWRRRDEDGEGEGVQEDATIDVVARISR
jgi:hypothetical protein